MVRKNVCPVGVTVSATAKRDTLQQRHLFCSFVIASFSDEEKMADFVWCCLINCECVSYVRTGIGGLNCEPSLHFLHGKKYSFDLMSILLCNWAG